MASDVENFEARLFEKGCREGRPDGRSAEELGREMQLTAEQVASVLRDLEARGWYRVDARTGRGELTAAAPARVPRFGSFATDGGWSEDRWGHRVFHPRAPDQPPPSPAPETPPEPGP